jgi:hypothetical protein
MNINPIAQQLHQPSITTTTISGNTSAAAAAAAGSPADAPVPTSGDSEIKQALPGVLPAAVSASQQILSILPVSTVAAAAISSSTGSVSVPSGLLLQLISNYQLTQQQQGQRQQLPGLAAGIGTGDSKAAAAAAAKTLSCWQPANALCNQHQKLQQQQQLGLQPGSSRGTACSPFMIPSAQNVGTVTTAGATAAGNAMAAGNAIAAGNAAAAGLQLPVSMPKPGTSRFVTDAGSVEAGGSADDGGVIVSATSQYCQHEEEELQEASDPHQGEDMYGRGEAGSLMKGKSKESKTRYADGT